MKAIVLSFMALGLLALPQVAQAQTVTQAFSFTGANQSFVVPAGITSLTVKLWGAGGGFGGGSGAFVTGLLSVTPGNTLTLIVGGGGLGRLAGPTGGFGGGGNGSGNWAGGGGRSAIRLGSTELVTAGAGGGDSAGGAGGLATGGNGAGGVGGGGGTQTAGGAGGGGGIAMAGSQFLGGNGAVGGVNGLGGGGGSGWFGGGGGYSGNSGGGGSSFLDNLTAAGASQAGSFGNFLSGVAPGGASDPDYVAGIGRGGSNAAGGNGRVVISYTLASSAPEPGSLAFLTLGGTLVFVKRRRK